jgi:hypothetical protein
MNTAAIAPEKNALVGNNENNENETTVRRSRVLDFLALTSIAIPLFPPLFSLADTDGDPRVYFGNCVRSREDLFT